jgi:hypothetical protein
VNNFVSIDSASRAPDATASHVRDEWCHCAAATTARAASVSAGRPIITETLSS